MIECEKPLPDAILDLTIEGRNVDCATLRALLDEEIQLLVFLRHQG